MSRALWERIRHRLAWAFLYLVFGTTVYVLVNQRDVVRPWYLLVIAGTVGGLVGAYVRDLDARGAEDRAEHIVKGVRQERDHYYEVACQLQLHLDSTGKVAMERLQLVRSRDRQINQLTKALSLARDVPATPPAPAAAEDVGPPSPAALAAVVESTDSLPIYSEMLRRP